LTIYGFGYDMPWEGGGIIMDIAHIDKLREYITTSEQHGVDESWCIGYVTAFQRTGLIDNYELRELTKHITKLYDR